MILFFNESKKKKNEVVFDSLFRQYYTKVQVFVFAIIRNREESENIAQDIFVKLLENADILEGIQNMDTYLYVVAKHAATRFLRKKQVEMSYDSNYNGNSESATIEDEFLAQEMLEYVEKIIATMPEQRRRVFMMSKIDCMSNDEIATMLGISKRTVESHLYSATKEIKDKVLIMLILFMLCS